MNLKRVAILALVGFYVGFTGSVTLKHYTQSNKSIRAAASFQSIIDCSNHCAQTLLACSTIEYATGTEPVGYTCQSQAALEIEVGNIQF